MDLTTLGTLVTIIYLLGIFAFQWFTDWFFNVTPSTVLDYISSGLKDLDDSLDEEP